MSETNLDKQIESEELILSVDKLQDFGINAADIQKLKISGVCSIAVSKTMNYVQY